MRKCKKTTKNVWAKKKLVKNWSKLCVNLSLIVFILKNKFFFALLKTLCAKARELMRG